MLSLLSPAGLRVDRRDLASRVALFSLDAETDFGTGRTEALDKIDRFADFMEESRVPWTAFVQGQFFESRRPLCRSLESRGVDLQLHCYDHGDPGDTPQTLARSAAAYADCLGRRPDGYRAHTYRLTRELYDALRAEGFRWDSSLMRAFAQGGNRAPGFLGGDYLVLDGDFLEFPIGTWNGIPVPFNHTHLLLARKPGAECLKRLLGPTRLVVYNSHMTDLVRSGSLAYAKRRRSVRLLYGYLWAGRGADTFAVFRGVIEDLRARGYAFKTTDGLSRELELGPTHPALLRARPEAPARR